MSARRSIIAAFVTTVIGSVVGLLALITIGLEGLLGFAIIEGALAAISYMLTGYLVGQRFGGRVGVRNALAFPAAVTAFLVFQALARTASLADVALLLLFAIVGFFLPLATATLLGYAVARRRAEGKSG